VRLAEGFAGNGQANDSRLLDTLAAAYAEAGRFDDALKTVRRAITIARANGQSEQAERYKERLKAYEAGEAYYEDTPAREEGEDGTRALRSGG
jgi:hypothetical protein